MKQLRRAICLVTLLGTISCSAERTPNSPVIQSPQIPKTADEVVQSLADSYREQNLELFVSLLANDPVNKAEFLFILDPAANANDPQWGFEEEARVHQRMFEPEVQIPGQTPVPAELWLTAVNITLTPSNTFTERTDLYQSLSNPDGLDPAKWNAMDAIYATDVLFDMQGDIDFQITGRANFMVVEDLEKEVGDAGKFLLLQWNDLASKAGVVISEEKKTWGSVKNLYN